MTDVRPFLVNGEWRTGEGTLEVKSPFDDSVVAEIGVPTAADVEEATAAAAETFKESQHLPIRARSEALDHISKRLGETHRGERRSSSRARAASRSSGPRSRPRAPSPRSAGPPR